jgi:hypothetical protein
VALVADETPFVGTGEAALVALEELVAGRAASQGKPLCIDGDPGRGTRDPSPARNSPR